jgi:hypothetical protein
VDARLFIRDSAINPFVLVKLWIPRAVRVVYNFFWTGMEVGIESQLIRQLWVNFNQASLH